MSCKIPFFVIEYRFQTMSQPIIKTVTLEELDNILTSPMIEEFRAIKSF